MHVIDRHVYANRGRGVDPAHKAALVLLVLALCLLLDRPMVGLLACAWMWVLSSLWAGLPTGVFGRVLLAQGSFLVLAVAGVALSAGTAFPAGVSWVVHVGPLAVWASFGSVDTALHLATRALGGTAALDFLVLTTPLVDIVELLRRLRIPSVLIDIVALTYRFIFILLESLDRMHNAQDSRLGYSSFGNAVKSAGLLGSRLFVDSYQRSKRLQIALDSRGYSGDLQGLTPSYRTDRSLWWLGAAATATLLIGRVLI
ncbi:MAG: cobalt ECF transporter T component CbiQ [Chloroflexi bacterium]|nr:cobalt ECF transporter T component CbiQ [Chloroflexota bacterium]